MSGTWLSPRGNFGPVWKTWTRWYNVGEIDRPRSGQSFIRYAGRWGEIGESGYTTGPRTPSFRAAWNGF